MALRVLKASCSFKYEIIEMVMASAFYICHLNIWGISMQFDLINEYYKLKEKGINVINLGIGEMGFDSPKEIRIESSKRCLNSKICYTNEKGIYSLRKKLADYADRKFGYASTYKNVLVTNGARQALFNILFSILEKDDEVIVVRPAWSGYEDMIKSLHGKVNPVLLDKKNNFFISAEQLISKVSEKTKVIIINTPGNPFGNIIEKSELKKLIEVSYIYDFKLILDIVYQDCGLCDESLDLSDFSLEELRNVVLVDSFSKRYAMSGWRVGYLVAARELIEKAAEIEKLVTNSVNTLSQYALMTKFNEEEYILKNRSILTMNYEWLKNFYKSHNYIRALNDPKHIYYTCIKLNGVLGKEYIAFAKKLLQEYNVLVTVLEFENDYLLRLSFACPTKTLMAGINCMDKCYNKYFL